MGTVKKLYIPYTWKERRVLIDERFWFGPSCSQDPPFHFEGWGHPALFRKKLPVYVEYCMGNGTWIIEKAKEHPHINWLGIEKRFDRSKRAWEKAQNTLLDNVAVAWAEGVWLTTQFFPTGSVDAVFVNFPDPWPKRRHAKHRIITPPFVTQMARILKPEGTITLVTDDEDYSRLMIREMGSNAAFKTRFCAPYYIEAPNEYGSSFFDSLFRSQQKMPRLHEFVKRVS